MSHAARLQYNPKGLIPGTHRKSEYSSLANLSTKLLFPTADSPVIVIATLSVQRESRSSGVALGASAQLSA